MRAQCRVEDTQERTPYREPPMALQPFHHLCSSKARVRQFLTGKKNPKQGKAILKNNYSQKATNITPKLPTGSPAGNLFEVSTWWRQRAELRGSAQAPSSCHLSPGEPCVPLLLHTQRLGSNADTEILVPAWRWLPVPGRQVLHTLCLRAQLSAKAKPQPKAAFPSNREEKQPATCPGSSGWPALHRQRLTEPRTGVSEATTPGYF